MGDNVRVVVDRRLGSSGGAPEGSDSGDGAQVGVIVAAEELVTVAVGNEALAASVLWRSAVDS